MTGRALIAGGALYAFLSQGWRGLALFAVVFTAVMLVIGTIHRGWYR